MTLNTLTSIFAGLCGSPEGRPDLDLCLPISLFAIASNLMSAALMVIEERTRLQSLKSMISARLPAVHLPLSYHYCQRKSPVLYI